jgi:hypothetical protein
MEGLSKEPSHNLTIKTMGGLKENETHGLLFLRAWGFHNLVPFFGFSTTGRNAKGEFFYADLQHGL